MRIEKHTVFLLLFVFSIIPMVAENTPCEEYQHINMTCAINRTCLYYDISNNGTITAPYVDSVWITNAENTEEVIMICYAQSGECIDIASLDRGHYIIYVPIDDNCIMARLFIYRGTPSNIGEISIDSLHAKEYKEGMLLIHSGGKTYTLQGTEIRGR